ncbi:putative MFS sugar transporter [Panus rudis PR-1116 ss-1]|nr:putative MFS sugar transporter [Panus rudis PR-1116 ss-1]
MGLITAPRLRAYRYCISAAFCMLLYGYDASAFNAVQGYTEFKDHFRHPDANVIGSVNTAYTVAAIIAGFFVSPWMSNTFGRRIAIFVGAFCVIIATFMQTFSPRTIAPYIVGRAVIGWGQGIALPAAATYISEVAPTEIRGRVLSFYQVFYSVGSFFCFWCAFGTTRAPDSIGNWRWQSVTLLQLLCPLMICSSMLFCPESPRWLVAHGYIDKARAVLQKTRAAENVEDELRGIEEAITYEQTQLAGISYKQFIVDPSVRWRFFLAVVINFGQQATGQGSLNSYSTIIYSKVFSSNSTVQLINALNATLGILFTLNATWMVERFGRKTILIGGALGQAACMFAVSLVGSQTPTGPNGEKSIGVAVGIVILLFSFIVFYKPSWGATVWIYSSEIFSMQTRAAGVAMATQTQNVANAILQQAFPAFLNKCGFYTFFFFMGFNIFLAIFCWWLLPETKGVSLEDIDAVFGSKSHRAAGQVIMDEAERRSVRKEPLSPTADEEKAEVSEVRREVV